MTYKIEIIRSPEWRHFTHADIGISMASSVSNVNNKNVELINWAAGRFDSVRVILADSLHRWNVAKDSSIAMPEAHKIANNLGDQWIKENSPKLHEKVSILRWDDALKQDRFCKIYSQYLHLFLVKDKFKEAIQNDIGRFLSTKREGKFDEDFCRQYLLEELTADTILAQDKEGAYFYLGSELESYKVIRDMKTTGLERQPHLWAKMKRRARPTQKHQLSLNA